MYLWTWVLTGLCLAGVLLVLVSLVPVIRALLVLLSSVYHLQEARLFVSLESLEIQRAHLESTAAQAAPLVTRAQAAVQRIVQSLRDNGVTQMRDAMQSTGAQVRALVQDLR